MTTPQERPSQEQPSAEGDATRQEGDAREQRRHIVKAVAHSSAMEGLPLSADMLGKLNDVADGTLTSEDLIAHLNAKYRR